MSTLKTTFNNLVESMKRYDLYQNDDEVGQDLDNLSKVIDEVEKRLECINKTTDDIYQTISKYTENVDKNEPFRMLVDDHDVIHRGCHDIYTAIDLEDDEPITENWYGLFETKEEDVPRGTLESTEDKVSRYFMITSHTHKQLEGKTFKVLGTMGNEFGHLIGELDCRHPEDETTDLWVNLDLDGVFVAEPTEDKVELSHGGIPYRVCYECSIKEEENVMTQVNGYWLCCDCNDEHKEVIKEDEPIFELDKTKFLPSTFDKVKQVIDMLKTIDNGSPIDGETMDYIVKELGFEEYLLRSLVMKSSFTDTKDLLREKFELSL
jgi:hypothetical protein